MGGARELIAREDTVLKVFARIYDHSMAAGLNLSLILLTVEPPNADADSSDPCGCLSTGREEIAGKDCMIWMG